MSEVSRPTQTGAGSTSYGGSSLEALRKVDPEIYDAIRAEEKRQRENIELIASENFTSRAVMEAQGSCLTNKYAEGYPKSVGTAVVKMSTPLSNSRSIAPCDCSGPNT